MLGGYADQLVTVLIALVWDLPSILSMLFLNLQTLYKHNERDNTELWDTGETSMYDGTTDTDNCSGLYESVLTN